MHHRRPGGGSHAIAASYSGDSGYPGSSGSLAGGQAVSQAPLTVTASDGAMTYGGHRRGARILLPCPGAYSAGMPN